MSKAKKGETAMMGMIGKSEGDWRAESDGRTLVAAKEIQQDKDRLKAALKWCKKQCDALEAVAGEDAE